MCFECGLFFGSFDPWGFERAEKSRSAKTREETALRIFNETKKKVEGELFGFSHAIIGLGCRPDSGSHFKLVPPDVVNHIFGYVRQEEETTSTAAQPKKKTEELDLADMSLYKPGNVITIPLTNPNNHLTGACWRDFSRAVRRNPGWDVKRIAATLEQKKNFRYRKGKVYFINALFTVPGGKKPSKKRASKKKTSSKTQEEDSKPLAAKKAKTSHAGEK